MKRNGLFRFFRDLIPHRVQRDTITAYDTSRLHSNFSSTYQAMIPLTYREWLKTVARAVQEYRVNPIMKRAVSTLVDRIAGSGLQPIPVIKENSEELAIGINKILSEDWKRYNDESCTQAGGYRLNAYEAQRMAIGTIITQGGVLKNRVRSKRGSMLPFSYQLINPTVLDWSHDDIYYTDNQATGLMSGTIFGMKVNATDFNIDGFYLQGIKEMISSESMSYTHHPNEIEEILGWPWTTASLIWIYDLTQTMMAKQIGIKQIASIPLWVKESNLFGLNKNANENVSWQFGSIIRTETEPKPIANTDKISEGFDPFVRLILRGIAMGFNCTYAMFAGDLEKLSYASAKFNQVIDDYFLLPMIKWFVDDWCKPDYQSFVEQEFFMGRIPGKSFTDYLEKKWELNQVYFLPKDSKPSVDPLKDAEATSLDLATGNKMFGDIAASKSMNLDEFIQKRKEEKEKLEAAGLWEDVKQAVFKVKEVVETKNDNIE
jgi:capsid protein